MQRLGVVVLAQLVERVIPGRQDFTSLGIEVAALPAPSCRLMRPASSAADAFKLVPATKTGRART
jgi:hypothetical protein